MAELSADTVRGETVGLLPVMNDYGPALRSDLRANPKLHIIVQGMILCTGGKGRVTHHGTGEPLGLCSRCRRLWADQSDGSASLGGGACDES